MSVLSAIVLYPCTSPEATNDLEDFCVLLSNRCRSSERKYFCETKWN